MAYFLIADDSDAKMGFLLALIKKENLDLDILRATTTEEAYELIGQHDDIACAFVDYEMPSDNGPAVIAALHAKNPATHIALVTAYNREEYEQEARAAGAQAFICTSLAEDEVKKNIADLLTLWKEKL